MIWVCVGRLTNTNFAKWRVSSDVSAEVLQQELEGLRDSTLDSAGQDEVLTELLLKLGYSLTEPIETIEVAGLTARSVGDGLLLAYLDQQAKPTLEQLRAMVDEEPAKLIVLEDAFQGDDELKTNLQQMCKTKDVELWTA